MNNPFFDPATDPIGHITWTGKDGKPRVEIEGWEGLELRRNQPVFLQPQHTSPPDWVQNLRAHLYGELYGTDFTHSSPKAKARNEGFRQGLTAAVHILDDYIKKLSAKDRTLPLPAGFPFAREVREEICATLEAQCHAPMDDQGNVDTSVEMDSEVVDAHRAMAEWLEACGPENNNPARARYIEKLKAAEERDWIEIPAFLRRGSD